MRRVVGWPHFQWSERDYLGKGADRLTTHATSDDSEARPNVATSTVVTSTTGNTSTALTVGRGLGSLSKKKKWSDISSGTRSGTSLYNMASWGKNLHILLKRHKAKSELCFHSKCVQSRLQTNTIIYTNRIIYIPGIPPLTTVQTVLEAVPTIESKLTITAFM
jgi:hypothetical protein